MNDSKASFNAFQKLQDIIEETDEFTNVSSESSQSYLDIAEEKLHLRRSALEDYLSMLLAKVLDYYYPYFISRELWVYDRDVKWFSHLAVTSFDVFPIIALVIKDKNLVLTFYDDDTENLIIAFRPFHMDINQPIQQELMKSCISAFKLDIQ